MEWRRRWNAARQRAAQTLAGWVWIATLAAGIGIVLVIWAIAWIDPKSPAERTDVIKTLAQVAGGAVLLVGLFFTYRTVKASQETLNVAIDKLNLDRETQLNERFFKASERLGDESEDVRIGAILSLERLAHDSERERKPIISLLCVLVRRRAQKRAVLNTPRVAEDIQAAISAIGSLGTHYTKRVGAPSVGLEYTDLRGCLRRG